MISYSLQRSGRMARSRFVLLIPLVFACLFAGRSALGAGLADFSSDGCSLFPDGTFTDRVKWCDCCLRHDISYWRGGTEEERKEADAALRDCVLERTGDRTLAEAMYLGVRAGGHPVFPNWYRWAYGWSYGRGYRPLTDEEREQARKKLEDYWRGHPRGYCAGKQGTASTTDRRDMK